MIHEGHNNHHRADLGETVVPTLGNGMEVPLTAITEMKWEEKK